MTTLPITYEEYETTFESWTKPDPGTYAWKQFWHERVIPLAQKVLVYEIEGKNYPRIRYGYEDEDYGVRRWPSIPSYAEIASTHPCRDCSVIQGQLHVPGCDVERCPNCHGQVISCDCAEEDEE